MKFTQREAKYRRNSVVGALTLRPRLPKSRVPALTRDFVENRPYWTLVQCADSHVRNRIDPGASVQDYRSAYQEKSAHESEMKIAASMARKRAVVRPERARKRAEPIARETEVTDTTIAATVLVVDDDLSVLRSLKRLVSASGFLVQTFDGPSELLASEIPRSNACMVVDIDMPEMNGIEMCEVLKQSGRGLPTILITGRTDTRIRTQAAQTDAVAVLFKPFDEEPLLEAIASALALSSRGRSDI